MSPTVSITTMKTLNPSSRVFRDFEGICDTREEKRTLKGDSKKNSYKYRMQFNLVLVLSTSFTFVVGTNPRNPPQNLKRSVTIPLQKPLDTKCKVKRDIRLSTCVSVAVPIIQIAVGIPRMGLHQEFKVILDTGSHGFLIPKRGLQNYGYPQFSYNPGQRYD